MVPQHENGSAPGQLVPLALTAAELGVSVDALADRIAPADISRDAAGIRCISIDRSAQLIGARDARIAARRAQRTRVPRADDPVIALREQLAARPEVKANSAIARFDGSGR